MRTKSTSTVALSVRMSLSHICHTQILMLLYNAVTVEMDTSIPVVWTYFLGLMKQKDRPLSIADNPLFYEAFPAKPSKRKPIDPITFERKLQEFASGKSFSSNQPLVVHVLLDRKASVSFEIAPSKFLVVTNIFRLSSDASFPRPRVVLRGGYTQILFYSILTASMPQRNRVFCTMKEM